MDTNNAEYSYRFFRVMVEGAKWALLLLVLYILSVCAFYPEKAGAKWGKFRRAYDSTYYKPDLPWIY